MENAIASASPISLGSTTADDGMALLDEFIRADGERLVRDPVKRIMFQRDLWGMFVAAGRPEVQRKLAAIIRRVALAPEEIESLPDNLTGTVKAKTFPTNYDS
ncbi:MAG TPA: hypothetical protein VKU80_16475, partial [Planctomycetota bacterium]|nr:hypothetical protein [Planctomycetota bacterium]